MVLPLHFQQRVLQVIARLEGKLPLPWEDGELSDEACHKLGPMRGEILAMLSRDPAQRLDMHSFHSSVQSSWRKH